MNKDKSDEAYKSQISIGTSLRDYFAGQALMGIMSNIKDHIDMTPTKEITSEVIAQDCYFIANAMIKERKKYG